jgi:hypothetical protein
MPSYQDIETRLQQVERKIDHIMKAFSVIVPSKIEGGEPQKLTMLDLYLEEQFNAKTTNSKVAGV